MCYYLLLLELILQTGHVNLFILVSRETWTSFGSSEILLTCFFCWGENLAKISYIKSYGFYFRVGEIFVAKKKSQKNKKEN